MSRVYLTVSIFCYYFIPLLFIRTLSRIYNNMRKYISVFSPLERASKYAHQKRIFPLGTSLTLIKKIRRSDNFLKIVKKKLKIMFFKLFL